MDFVRGELREALVHPEWFLLPEESRPARRRKSKVHTSGKEWHDIVKLGLKLGIMGEVPERDYLLDEDGKPIVIGAMGVDKEKGLMGRRSSAFELYPLCLQ